MTSEVIQWTGPSLLKDISKRLIPINRLELINEETGGRLSLWERNSRRHHNLDLSRGVELAQKEFKRSAARAPASGI